MRWLMIGYMYLFIHRPFEFWPALGEFRIELLYSLFAGGVWLVAPGKRWLPNPMHRAVCAFLLALLTAGLFSPWQTQTHDLIYRYLTLLFFYLLLVTMIHEEDGLKQIGQAFLVIMSIYMMHSLWEYLHGRFTYRMSIVRLVGVDITDSDPNSFAATLVYALTLVPAMWFASVSWRWRGFLIFYGVLTAGCIALTGSRAGFVSLVLWSGLCILRSRWRVGLCALAVASAPVLWCALPPSLQNRFETIIHPEVGPLNAQVSAEGRLEGFWLGIQLWEQNPLTGCGPGAWRPATRRPIESHNLYGQVMGEMGTLGVLAFAAVVLAFWSNIRRVRRAYRDNPGWERGFLYHLSGCLGMALFMLLLNGNFGHNLYRYTWIWFGAFAIIARHCVEQRLAGEAGVTYAPAPAAVAGGRLGWGGEAA
jgi:O-antigen ligase